MVRAGGREPSVTRAGRREDGALTRPRGPAYPPVSLLLERQTHGTVGPIAVLPVSDDLARGGAVVDSAGLARLTSGHVVENILHGPAVGESALPLLTAGLLPVSPGTLVGVEEQHQLLLDQLPLLRVS